MQCDGRQPAGDYVIQFVNRGTEPAETTSTGGPRPSRKEETADLTSRPVPHWNRITGLERRGPKGLRYHEFPVVDMIDEMISDSLKRISIVSEAARISCSDSLPECTGSGSIRERRSFSAPIWWESSGVLSSHAYVLNPVTDSINRR